MAEWVKDVSIFLSKIKGPLKPLYIVFVGANLAIYLSYKNLHLEIKFRDYNSMEQFHERLLSIDTKDPDEFSRKFIELIKEYKGKIRRAKFYELPKYLYKR